MWLCCITFPENKIIKIFFSFYVKDLFLALKKANNHTSERPCNSADKCHKEEGEPCTFCVLSNVLWECREISS